MNVNEREENAMETTDAMGTTDCTFVARCEQCAHSERDNVENLQDFAAAEHKSANSLRGTFILLRRILGAYK